MNILRPATRLIRKTEKLVEAIYSERQKSFASQDSQLIREYSFYLYANLVDIAKLRTEFISDYLQNKHKKEA